MKIAIKVVSLMALGLGAVMLSGCATAPAYRVEDGRIVLDSPFVLEIGSTEYAKTLGDLIRTSAHAHYDPQTKTTTTNFYHNAEAWLATPYFGCKRVWLNFEGEAKALSHCHFSFGEAGWSGGKMTYAECCETVRKIVADVEKRIDVKLICRDEEDEASVKERIAAEEKREKRSERSCFSLSFNNYGGSKTLNGVPVEYSVSGMYSSRGGCSVRLDYSKSWRLNLGPYKPGDKIPVYTNEMVSAVSGSLVPAEEQKAAHEEAKKLRETIKRLFDVDLDKPSETYDLLSVASLTNAEKDVKREWAVMEKPFEGLTERRVNLSVRLFAIPFGSCALRCPYEGDVTAAELGAQAKRILAGLERELGAKIPEADTKDGVEMLAKRFGEGVPTYGDTKALLGLDKKTHFMGKVGDLAIEIGYAEPRYAKKGDKYEITCKGAVVVNFVQSPIVTKGKPK